MKIIFLLYLFFNTAYAQDDFFEDNTEIQKEAEIFFDPLESVNRKTFKVVKLGNNLITLPAARIYDKIVPSFLHLHIRSFIVNTYEPITTINGVLIPHKPLAIASASRFLTNTIFGLGGFFDIHSQYTKPNPQISLDDIAQYYFNKPLPYLVLPMGFGNVFSIADWLQTGKIFSNFRNNGYSSEILTLTLLNITTAVHTNKDQIDDTLNHSLDPYAILRDVYYRIQLRKLTQIAERPKYNEYKFLISTDFH
jgi:phospholipid-binding lipoprotein MlaA